MYGWRGKILRVDLTAQEITEENLDPKVARDYIGGRGLGVYFLNREADPACEPLTPENMMVMAAGPLTGTSRRSLPLYGKKPADERGHLLQLRGAVSQGAEVGGYDALVFTGGQPSRSTVDQR
jgi:aldehyde:ferredoxin oxidoreductase